MVRSLAPISAGVSKPLAGLARDWRNGNGSDVFFCCKTQLPMRLKKRTMEENRWGIFVGLLLLGLAIATVAAGLAVDHWTGTVSLGPSKFGQMSTFQQICTNLSNLRIAQ